MNQTSANSTINWVSFLFIALSLTVVSGCTGSKVISDVGKAKLRFSVLTINLQGTYDNYGQDRPTWQTRYSRIGNWMATNNKIPDFIALQEVHGQSGGLSPFETLFTLLSSIKVQTNVSYRIAYLTVRPVPQGLFLQPLWAGNALLYNPDRINNRTFGSGSTTITSPFDNETAIGVHARKSLPCQTSNNLCSQIDGDGVSWVSSYRGQDGRWYPGPSFARFELKDPSAQGRFIHMYNLHVQYQQSERNNQGPPTIYLAEFNRLLQNIESRFTNEKLYPPVVLGDFNLGEGDVLSNFNNFEKAGYDRDVEGVLVGNYTAFNSSQRAYYKYELAPEDFIDPATNGQSACGHVGILWSDHCAMFVQFSPAP